VNNKKSAKYVKIAALTAYFSTILYFFYPSVAYAYIDPATTSYIIQVAAGLIITLSVAIGVLFSKMRMILVMVATRISVLFYHVQKKGVHNSTDRNEKHPDATPSTSEQGAEQKPGGSVSADELPHVIPPTDRKRFPDTGPRAQTGINDWHSLTWGQRAKARWQDDRSWKMRLALALLLSLAVSFTFFLFGPLDIVIASGGEMGYGIADIAPAILILGLIIFLAFFLVLILLRGYYLEVVATVIFALLLCGYIQGTFLNEGLIVFTGEQQGWQTMIGAMVVNSLIWAAIIVAVFVIRSFLRYRMNYAVMAVSALLVLMQGVALINMIPPVDQRSFIGKEGTSLTTYGQFALAPGHNVVVFLLDECDVQYTAQLESEEPGYFDRLDGFTEYTNNVWIHTDTNPSVPEILTGIPYEWNQDVYEWQEQAYRGSRLMNPLSERDYGIKLYLDEILDYPRGRADILDGVADNIEATSKVLKVEPAVKTLIKVAAYRFVPLVMKPFFWISPNSFAENTEAITEGDPQYVINDELYNKNLRAAGLSIDTEGYENQFVFYHMNGPHLPFILDENTRVIPESEGTATKAIKGSFNYIFFYIDQLKQLGKYEDTTIIILADHGNRRSVNKQRDEPTTPICFVKPSGAINTPFTKSSAPLVTENVRATILNDAGVVLSQDQQTCAEVPEDLEIARPVVCRYGKNGIYPYYVTTFDVTGDASDWSNWHLIEVRNTDYWA
jgi:hypothetical protein